MSDIDVEVQERIVALMSKIILEDYAGDTDEIAHIAEEAIACSSCPYYDGCKSWMEESDELRLCSDALIHFTMEEIKEES